MALTSGGSITPRPSAATGAAQFVQAQGANRAERLNRIAAEAANGDGVPGSGAPSEAFFDGDSLPRLDSENRPDVRQTAQINGEGSGFPGLADAGYTDIPGNPQGVEQSNRKDANVVKRGASVKGGQAGGPVASDTSEPYNHGSSAGFPFEVPSPRQL